MNLSMIYRYIERMSDQRPGASQTPHPDPPPTSIMTRMIKPDGFRLAVRVEPSIDRQRDIVVLERTGETFLWDHWLRLVRRSADLVRRALDDGGTSEAAVRAARWLTLNGIRSERDFEYLVEVHLPLLELPPDSSAARTTCLRCGAEIWGRESLLTGLGSDCRRSRRPRNALPGMRGIAARAP
jgi:hypothetical protein